MSDADGLTDPIARAEAASAHYTVEMHTEARDRLTAEMWAIRRVLKLTSPRVLDLYETAIYHAAHSREPSSAANVYGSDLGGYLQLGIRMGEYRRGLRLTGLLMRVLGADYMDLTACPAHDHNLYRMALGQPADAERETRRLLDHGRTVAQNASDERSWKNPLAYFAQSHPEYGFVMYEGVFLLTLCDAHLAQGQLRAAEAIANDLLREPYPWGVSTRGSRGRNGANPPARRALARAWSGDVYGAAADFEAADSLALKVALTELSSGRDWHHRPHHAAFVARLGYLSGGQYLLERMNLERVRIYRPLTAAEWDLAAADIAYARGDHSAAEDHAGRVLAWAGTSGHQHTGVRAQLMLARLALRTQPTQADERLGKAEAQAKQSGFALQQVDALILRGYLALQLGDITAAEAAAAAAETLSEPLPYRWGAGDAAHLLARCAEARGDAAEALRHAERASAVRSQIRDPKARHTQALIGRLGAQAVPPTDASADAP